MPRRTTVFAEGEFFHVFNRGALRHTLFYNHIAYMAFLDLVKHFASEHNIRVVVICLMPNHFHLLVQIGPNGDLSGFMNRVCNHYSKRINRHLRRTGTVFEGRFKAKHVSTSEYVRQLCKYIHANPVKAGLTLHPDSWPYSNYLEFIDKRNDIHTDKGYYHRFFESVADYEDAVLSLAGQSKIPDGQMAEDLASMQLL